MPVSLRKSLPSALCILLGSLLYAFTVHLFILPGNLMSSGTTGIALTVCRLRSSAAGRHLFFSEPNSSLGAQPDRGQDH